MADNSSKSIAEIIQSDHKILLEDWLSNIKKLPENKALDLMNEDQLRIQTSALLRTLLQAFEKDNYEDITTEEFEDSISILENLSSDGAAQGFTPTETAVLVLSLKDTLHDFLEKETGQNISLLNAEIKKIDKVIDKLALVTFEAYTDKRERVISKQTQELMELSTPIIQVWDKILLLPLIGVIDTNRASQIVEKLLETIVEQGAEIALLDITGVPVMDTAVAANLITMTTAVKMLGAEVVMTGISPETAQTLVKLGIDLAHISTQGRLQTGIKEAFRHIGKKIVDK